MNKKAKPRRIYRILWTGIIMVSIYLIARFLTMSFSDNIGQADASLIDSLCTDLSCKTVKDGASLVGYMADGKGEYSFPTQLVADGLALADFTEKNAVMTVQAQVNNPLAKDSADTAEQDVQEVMNTEDVINSEGELNRIAYDTSPEKSLTMEYIMTNGSVCKDSSETTAQNNNTTDTAEASGKLRVGYEHGDIQETGDTSSKEDSAADTAAAVSGTKYTLKQLENQSFLLKNFYIVDSSTRVTEKLFDADELLGKDMKIKQDNKKPQILIYHTHSQESFIDSRVGKEEDTVVGVGNQLTEILEKTYGYNVIHDKTKYDIVNGVLNRNIAYNKSLEGITKTLKENPSIDVLIDLHRDSGAARNIKINGKESAMVMLFNGLSRDQNGPITYLNNPNLQNNLAFSLQLQLKGKELYPGLFTKNYLKSYRYNLQMRPKSLLVELGTDKNTVQSAKNAMEPFAKVLDEVLRGK